MGQPPTLGRIGKGPDQFEGLLVDHKTDLRFPGQLVDLVIQDGDALAEEFIGQPHARQHLTGRRLDPTQGGLAVESRAFVKYIVFVDQPLGPGAGIMGIVGDDLVAVLRPARTMLTAASGDCKGERCR